MLFTEELDDQDELPETEDDEFGDEYYDDNENHARKLLLLL
jgi:hypothetical protein